jgi:hypothetical protein
MRRRIEGIVAGMMILLMAGCIDQIPLRSTDYRENIVIEGFLSSENAVQRVSVSRTSILNERHFSAETGASVWIENSSGIKTLFPETQPGRYETVASGVVGQSYTLHVVLKDARSYVSEPVVLRPTPPIKQLNAEYKPQQSATNAGIYFTVDASDSTNQTRFYRWDFESTFEIKTPFPSSYEWLGGNDVQARNVPISQCWAMDTLRNVVIASSFGLSSDQVINIPLQFVPSDSYAMRIKYSLLVKQYSLTQAGYEYWKLLRAINQTLGSLYDIQPGTVIGNIHNVNDNKEIVLGYFDACMVRYKRAFYTPANFNAQGYKAPGYLTSCQNLIPYEVPANQIGAFMAKTGTRNDLVISESTGSYEATLILRPRYCCDCTKLGTNVKPNFWH